MITHLHNEEFSNLAIEKNKLRTAIDKLCKKEEYGVFAWMVINEDLDEFTVEIRFDECIGDEHVKISENRQKLASEIVKVLNLMWVISVTGRPEEGMPLIVTVKQDRDYIIE